MELKKYQRKVLDDLVDYLDLYKKTSSPEEAYKQLWLNKGVNVGFGGVQKYVNELSGVPQICTKVPTGGGKTFIASAAIKRIFDFLPANRKVVVWLVPSETILTQTYKNLSDTNHPYRQRLNRDFSSRVYVYTKEEALNAQNFNISTVEEQLSIFVMSFDSFRSRKKEDRKVYQENSNLAQFTKTFKDDISKIENADISSLMQVFNHLNPVVIVDESHNATSNLSVKMIKELNPSFVLDLTATPRENSNVISFVDAMQLKKENMVKLPVIVYNRPSQKQVIVDSIDLRNKLEKVAQENEKKTGVYIRPIVLFQAQPRTDSDNTTFEILKSKLIDIGIPEEEIAIKTANINEIKNVQLESKDCKIKYIITVNALKEGWDCPSAYILASLSNRSSTVDVEQIVGRILRQPFARSYDSSFLNMSYVLTSSSDFNRTLEVVLNGLNSAGFSDKDFRAFNCEDIDKNELPEHTTDLENEQIQTTVIEDADTDAGFVFEVEEVKNELKDRTSMKNTHNSQLTEMLSQAEILQESYISEATDSDFGGLFGGEKDMLNIVTFSNAYEEFIKEVKLPQFYIKVTPNIFNDATTLLSKDHLLNDFKLSTLSIPTNVAESIDEVVKVDIEEGSSSSRVRTVQLSGRELTHFKEYLSSVPDERLASVITDSIYNQLQNMNNVSATDLKKYIGRVIGGLKQDELLAVRENFFSAGHKIKKHIDLLKNEHAYLTFKTMIEKNEINVEYKYMFPKSIAPIKSTDSVSKSLYFEEYDDMNGTELEIIRIVAGYENVKCWHRIKDRNDKEFCLNGFTNHYPDFVVFTNNGNTILLEVKGEHLSGLDTKRKAELGKIWQNSSTYKHKYFMVYKDKNATFEGAYKLNDFLDILKSL